MVSTSIRRNLLASTIIAGALVTSIPALAQGANGAAPQQPADAAADASDTIVVTGSLISNPNLQQASPVNVTTSEEIQLRQSNVAEEVLRDIPGIVPSVGSAVNNGNGGASFVDLRGLGSTRNVVLLDGNRIVPSGLAGRVDLNNIPLALVERVEALTGGASTTYGADAVAGAVNFITRKDFAGVEISSGEQITEKGDGNYFRTDVTIGANFDDGRGNAVFSIGYQESDPVYQGSRDFAASAVDSFTGTLSGSGTAVPSRISGTRPLITGTTTPNTTAPFVQVGVTAGGTPILAPVAAGIANGGVRQINQGRAGLADGSATAGIYAPFNFNPYNIFQTPFTRFNMFGSAHYQISDGIEIYTRGLFSKNTVRTIIAPSGDFGATVQVPLSNPYLPAVLRNQLCAFNTAPNVNGVNAAGATVSGQIAYTPRFTPAECAAAATATSPTDPNFRAVSVTLNRRLVEGSPRTSQFTTNVFDYRAGLRGNITDSIKWDVSGGYGESENRQTLGGYVLTSRVRSAVYATNTTTCLGGATGGAPITQAPGCVPVNIFGPAGSITANQIPYLTAASSTVVKTSLAQARALVSGDFGVSSPWASDPISFAAGGEYRHYQASQDADILGQTVGELGGAGGVTPVFKGGYDVYEAIGEVAIPLISDKPGFDSLTVNGGIRYSHYTIDAANQPKFNTTTYKGELIWQPVRDIKLRGSYAHSVRAPNISELFTPVTTGLTNLATDPCAGAAPTTNANLRAVCLAQGAPAGTIGSITNPTAGQANIATGGSTSLKPEIANSYTGGVVLQPTFLPGFTATADYYTIRITKAITTPTPGDIVNNCFGMPTGGVYTPTAAAATDPACTTTRRNSVTGTLDGDPAISPGLFAALSNLGKIKTSGIDVTFNYSRPLDFLGSWAGDDVKLALSFSGNYTFEQKFQATPTSINRECVGRYSVNCGLSGSIQPKFEWNQRTTLSFGDVDVSFLWQHIDGNKYEPLAAAANPAFVGTLGPSADPFYSNRAVNFSRIKAYDKFDLTTRFGITSNLDLTLTVQNLFDKQPPLVGYDIGATAFNSGNTYPSTYDALGRRYAVGAKLKF